MRRRTLILFALPGVIGSALLLVLAVVAPRFAGWMVTEDGPIEWMEVALALMALGFVGRSAARRFSPADVLFGATLAEMVVAEIDLDQRLFGMAVIDWKFFRRPAVSLPVRALVAAAIVCAVGVLVVYCLLRWRALWCEVWAGFSDGWAWLLLVGAVLYGIPQPCERCMNYLLPLPTYFLEESLELLGLVYAVLAMAMRSRR
ncbi:MAG: hypothetical protein DMD95_14885 [Candidatus Rokuibacteriota bacterium]|nr:MAG: hypothetical protein DMD95_14885 [Candidatus Rokubacteria bacterium]